MSKGTIKKVAGPLVIAEGMRDANMFDVVRVSSQRLIGEIIEMHGDEASIQVYEETSGLGPGEPVESMEVPAVRRVGAGPDREHLRRHPAPAGGHYEGCPATTFKRGVEVPSLKRDQEWHFAAVQRSEIASQRATSSEPCRRRRSSTRRSWCPTASAAPSRDRSR